MSLEYSCLVCKLFAVSPVPPDTHRLHPVSPDEDSESVSSSLDGSVYSEEGGLGMVEEKSKEDLQFQLSERIDQLGDKR